MPDIGIDRKKQRLITFLFFFLSGIVSATWSSRIPDIQQKLHLSNARLGTVLFFIPVGMVTGLSFASWIVANYGPRKILLASCLLCCACLSFSAFSNFEWQLIIVLFFLGIGRTVYNLAANASAIDVQQLYTRPIISGFHGIWSVACFIGGGLSTWLLINNISLNIHFVIISAVVSIICLWLFARQPEELIHQQKRPFFVMPDKYLLLLGSIGLCSMLCEGAVFDWSVNYFEKAVHAPKSLRTLGYLCFIITMACGRLVGDQFVHKYGAYKIIFINGLLMTVGFAIASLLPYLIPAAIGFLLVGVGDSILIPVIFLLAAKSKKMPPAYAISSVTLIGYTGFLIGPLLIGNIAQQWSFTSALFILSILSFFVVLLSSQIKKLIARE